MTERRSQLEKRFAAFFSNPDAFRNFEGLDDDAFEEVVVGLEASHDPAISSLADPDVVAGWIWQEPVTR